MTCAGDGTVETTIAVRLSGRRVGSVIQCRDGHGNVWWEGYSQGRWTGLRPSQATAEEAVRRLAEQP